MHLSSIRRGFKSSKVDILEDKILNLFHLKLAGELYSSKIINDSENGSGDVRVVAKLVGLQD